MRHRQSSAPCSMDEDDARQGLPASAPDLSHVITRADGTIPSWLLRQFAGLRNEQIDQGAHGRAEVARSPALCHCPDADPARTRRSGERLELGWSFRGGSMSRFATRADISRLMEIRNSIRENHLSYLSIWTLVVDPAFEGRGIAPLIREACKSLITKGHRISTLSTSAGTRA